MYLAELVAVVAAEVGVVVGVEPSFLATWAASYEEAVETSYEGEEEDGVELEDSLVSPPFQVPHHSVGVVVGAD